MRKYQRIWMEIKANPEATCKIAAHPSLHRRIKKAVCKEKYKDLGYKVQWDIAGYNQPVLDISTDTENSSILVFKLLKPIVLGDL